MRDGLPITRAKCYVPQLAADPAIRDAIRRAGGVWMNHLPDRRRIVVSASGISVRNATAIFDLMLMIILGILALLVALGALD
jgi:hypothetical protein